MWLVVPAAIAAGACFASAGLFQQRAASQKPSDESLSPRLLLELAREPLWLAGISLAVLSYVFQAVALALGPLSVVQPLIVSELIFALPISARMHGLRLHTREWLAAATVAIGLGVAIVSADPQEGNPLAPLSGWLLVLAAVGGLVVLALLIGRRAGDTWKASSFALAAGVVMGTQSAVFSATITLVRKQGFGMFLNWQPYVLIILSIGGLTLIQSAYQAGPLAASLPVLDGAEPAVAVVLGLALFGETIASGALRFAGMGIGIVAVVSGIILLDTSPVIHKVHQREEEEATADTQTDP